MIQKKSLAFCVLSLLLLPTLVYPVAATNSQEVSAKGPIPVIISLSKGETWGPQEFTAKRLGVDVTLVIIAKGKGTLTIKVEDLYIMGDTMFVNATKMGIQPETAYDEGTSPDAATVTLNVLLFALTTAKIGYKDCPGGFPAGYQITVTFE